MPSRRSVLVGLGGLVAGGGALIGTGAFTTVEAERTVNVETAGDGSALLTLEPAGDGDGDTLPNAEEYVTAQDGDTISIDLSTGDASGLNQNAKTTLLNLVDVTNNGSQEVGVLEFEILDGEGEPLSADAADNVFSFPINGDEVTVDNGNDVTEKDNIDDALGIGDTITFGLIIDLIGVNLDNAEEGALPEEGEYTLQIRAEAAES